MKTFTVYRQSMKSKKQSVDIINRVGWEGVKYCNNTSATLCLDCLCLTGDNPSKLAKAVFTIEKALEENVLFPVAKVTCENLENAFTNTLSNDKLWIENEHVTLLESTEEVFYNDTCCGDIFKDDQTGIFHVVLMMGFCEI